MPSAAKTSIVIVDDHPIFRDGLRRLLEAEPDIQVVGEAADGREALELIQKKAPELVLLDVAMPRMGGIETLRQLAAQRWGGRAIVLTARIEHAETFEALRLGARGVVLKESATQVLLKAIRRVLAGELWAESATIAALTGRPAAPAYRLTPRELEIVAQITAGASNRDIADALGISEETVKRHLSNIYEKTGVSTRLELALFALHKNLVPRP